jgi:hypothetical protein
MGTGRREQNRKRVQRLLIAASGFAAALVTGVALPSGASGGLMGIRILYSAKSAPIPDGHGAAKYSFQDSDWPATGSVTAQVRVRHERTQQLDLTLRAPDGDKVALSQGDTHGKNLGRGACDAEDSAAAEYTGFRDTMSQSLSSGSAPYVDWFQPAEPLSSLAGDPGPGKWQLIVKDTRDDGTAGVLKCGIIRIAYNSGR